MKRLTSLILLLAFSAGGAIAQTKQTKSTKKTSTSTPTSTRVLPEEWYPALHPSLETLLEQLKADESQMGMNRLSRQVADVRDAQLFIAYVRLYDRLSAKERTALVQEQTEWLKKRAKAASAALKSKGSMAPLEANDAEATMTEQRLRELRDRFKKLQKKTETVDE
jgi:uncharacterized protein YecT (DUF1311 family)